MKIFCDGKAITPAALVTYEGMNSVYREKGGELQYIEGSRTYDTLRYGKNNSQLPFEFTFTDRYNHKWKVVLDRTDDTVNMFIPCGFQMLWYGADESPTRTGSDAQTQWASVQFSWQDTTMLPPFHAGVRTAFSGYKDKTTGEWSVDTERWNNILELGEKGTKVTGAVMEQIEKGVAIASGH